MNQKTSFDVRLVRYEDIHSIQQADFASLLLAAGIVSSSRVLDCGCGYGAVTREVIRATESLRGNESIRLDIDLLDESAVQLARAREELSMYIGSPGVQLAFINGTFPDGMNGNHARYDRVICKMVIHEVKRVDQGRFVDAVFDRLIPGGGFVFWDLCLSDDTAEFFRSVIRRKDTLVGYDTMVERRFFLSEADLLALFGKSKFPAIDFIDKSPYLFEAQKRLIPEFGGDQRLYRQWCEYIRNLAAGLPDGLKEKIGYQDSGDDITFNVIKAIARATRPHA